ncbi:hypothetical protein CCACVL1_24168 [Corchorus capsularis]|uniref:Endoplasmic reticulum metallopeptidase 1-like C-terminal domain-containing protein n=1 Tax=Corchorus capsularis TaxID=210143 RepID=A0A1R3GQP5_COCAP|nr:hypothetical protein CCACVL1_24168 [Corchorus capsularis]
MSNQRTFMALFPVSFLFSGSLKFPASNDQILKQYKHFPHLYTNMPQVKSDDGSRRVYLELSLGSLEEIWVAVLNITGPLSSWSFADNKLPVPETAEGGPPSYILRLTGTSHENWTFWLEASNSGDLRVDVAVLDQVLVDEAKKLRRLFPAWADVVAYSRRGTWALLESLVEVARIESEKLRQQKKIKKSSRREGFKAGFVFHEKDVGVAVGDGQKPKFKLTFKTTKKHDDDVSVLPKIRKLDVVQEYDQELEDLIIKPSAKKIKKDHNPNPNPNYKGKAKMIQEDDQQKPAKRSKKGHPAPVCPNPNSNPSLPEHVKEYIINKGGSDIALVIQKRLYFTDINPTASRLSIPISQIKTSTSSFLTESETVDLERGIAKDVSLLEPSMKESVVTFSRWNYSGTNSSYVLKGQWNAVVQHNGLKAYDMVQLWSFRVASNLCFALVKLDYVPSSS